MKLCSVAHIVANKSVGFQGVVNEINKFAQKFNRRTGIEFNSEPSILLNCWLALECIGFQLSL